MCWKFSEQDYLLLIYIYLNTNLETMYGLQQKVSVINSKETYCLKPIRKVTRKNRNS